MQAAAEDSSRFCRILFSLLDLNFGFFSPGFHMGSLLKQIYRCHCLFVRMLAVLYLQALPPPPSSLCGQPAMNAPPSETLLLPFLLPEITRKTLEDRGASSRRQPTVEGRTRGNQFIIIIFGIIRGDKFRISSFVGCCCCCCCSLTHHHIQPRLMMHIGWPSNRALRNSPINLKYAPMNWIW